MRWSRSFTINISSLSLVFHSWFIFSCLSLCPELHISLLFHIQKTPGRDEIKGEREVNEGQDIRKQEPRDKDDVQLVFFIHDGSSSFVFSFGLAVETTIKS
jgi:hypothetical protein